MLTPERAKKYRTVISSAENPFAVLIAAVDPDSIASAIGVATAIRSIRGASETCRIFYAGKIGHRQNHAMIKACGLEKTIRPISEMNGAPYTFALVDSWNMEESRLPEPIRGQRATVIIDHHDGHTFEEEPDRFIMIETTGAAATLVTELLTALEIDFDVNQTVALALAFGIHNDTKGLLKAQDRDLQAYFSLRAYVRDLQFKELVRFPITENFLRNELYALGHYKRQGAILVTGIGFIKTEAEEHDHAIIADNLIRVDGIRLAVVWAIHLKGSCIKLSARSQGMSISLDDLLCRKFGEQFAGAKVTQFFEGEGGAIINFNFGEMADLMEQADSAKPLFAEFVQKMMEEVFFHDQ